MPREEAEDLVLDEEFEDEEEGLPERPVSPSMYGTEEGRSIARSTYDRVSDSLPQLDADEEEAFKNYEKSARKIRLQLQSARDKLLAQKRSRSQALLAAAAGLAAPTRSGSFFESASNALRAYIPEAQREQDAEAGRQRQALELDSSIGSIDQNLAAQRLKLIGARRSSATRLLAESMKNLSKTTRPAAQVRAQSTYGRIAADEGFKQGTPEFTARVAQLRAEDQDLQREKSGVDVDEGLGGDDRRALATRFGVPVTAVDPYQGLSTKARQAARQRAAAQTQKDLTELNSGLGPLLSSDTDIDRFLVLNKNTPSGKIRGLNPFPGAEGDEMDSITARAARAVRQPGEGSVSNFDAQQFIKGTLSRTKPYETNKNLATALKSRNKLIKDRVRFFNDYATVNDGSLTGAQSAWEEYLEANPIFDPTKPGALVLNPNRKSYQDYFRLKSSDKPAFAEGGEVDEEAAVGEGTVLKPNSKRERQRLQAALQGLTLGLSDELGGLGSLVLGDGYESGRDYVRRDLEEGSNEAPIGSFASEMAGAVPPTVAAGLALKRIASKYDVQRTGRARSKTGRAVQLATRLAPKNKYAQAAITGGAAGAVAGANSEGDLEQRAQRAKEGAIFGTVLGPVATAGTQTVGKLGRKVVDKITGVGGSPAERRVAQALVNDQVDPATVAAQVAEDARNAVPSRLADFGGAETQALAQTAASRSGANSQALARQTNDLQAGARERVEDQINRRLKPDPYFDQEKKLVGELRKNADPAYKAANQINIPVTPELQALLATPSGQRAYAQAIRNMADDQIAAPQAPAGTLNTQVLQYIKEELGGMIQSAKSGSQPDDNAARRFGALQRRLVELMDNANPAYKKARLQYGDDAEVLGALRAGRDEILDLQPEQIAEKVAGLSFTARDALRTGVARALIEEVRTPRRAKNFAELINSPQVAQQVAATFERPGDAKIFLAALRREAQLYGTRLAQSRTSSQMRNQALRNQLSTNVPAEAVGAAGEGAGIASAAMGDLAPLGVMARVLAALRNRIPLSEAAADDVARVLQTGTPAEINKMMANFEKFGAMARKRQEVDEAISNVSAGSAGAAYGSAPPQGYSEE